MSLKNPYRIKLNVFVFCFFFSFFYPNIFALDLKIDLPLSEGKEPVLYYDSNQHNEENDLPPPPESLIQKEKKRPIENSDFPELVCLKDSVDFWEKVYTQVDTNQAVIHDRDHLNRIYKIVNLPKNKKHQSAFIKFEKKGIENLLSSLSKKLNKTNSWTPAERKIAHLFNRQEFNAKNLQIARENVRTQTGLKSQFEAGIRRSMLYLPQIYSVVRQSGLPMDLVYLPHVESSYNPKAGSKVGAQGLWQLMPSTMRILEGKDSVKLRKDPLLSTRAAMKLLKGNYEKTKNWPLALTAYNYGQNGILRAIQKTRSHNLCTIIDRYESPSFKFASSNFYAQFLAARKIAMHSYLSFAKSVRPNELLRHTLNAVVDIHSHE